MGHFPEKPIMPGVLIIEAMAQASSVMVSHSGNFNPEEKFGIVVISNGCHPGYSNGFNTVIRKTVNAIYDNLIVK